MMSSHQGHQSNAQGLRADYLARAQAWDAAGRPDHAAHLYAAALDLEPADVRTRLRLAECLVRCGQLSAAAGEYLRTALEYAAHRRDREALALCFRVLQLDARHLVYVALADALRRIGRESRGLCAAAAEAHLAAGRVSDGLHMLRLGVELDARNPEVRRRLATLYRSQHMTTDAVTHLAEAGRLLLAAGNNAEYIEVAQELLCLSPRHLETLRDLPRAYLRVGEPRRAVVMLADLMRVSPGDIVGYEILAHAFAAIDRVSTCLSVLERLVSELRATGRTDHALAILDRAPGWRLDDSAFAKAVQALRRPKVPKKPAPVRPQTAEGTVVLDVRDLLPNRVVEDTAVLAGDDVVELGDAEGTMVLRLEDLSHVGPAPARPAPPRKAPTVPPPRPRVAAPLPPPPRRRLAVPLPRPRVVAPSPSPSDDVESTMALDLSEIELDDDTQVQRTPSGDVTELVFDEDSDELADAEDGQTLRLRARPRRPISAPPPA